MRKRIQEWVFVVGVLVGGALGTVHPAQAQAEAQASGEWCQNQCADEGCYCYYRCYSMGPHCICEEFPTCY
jgi:hypothetical protein